MADINLSTNVIENYCHKFADDFDLLKKEFDRVSEKLDDIKLNLKHDALWNEMDMVTNKYVEASTATKNAFDVVISFIGKQMFEYHREERLILERLNAIISKIESINDENNIKVEKVG